MMTKQEKISAVVKYGMVLVGAWLIAPFVFQAIGGLIGLGIAAALAWIIAEFAPVVGLGVSMLAMKALKGTIRENPVEARQVVQESREKELRQIRDRLKDRNTSVGIYETRVEKITKQYPDEAQKFVDHLLAMKGLLERQYQALKVAEKDLAQYRLMTNRVEAIWEMTKASEAIEGEIGLLTESDALKRIVNDESIKAAEEGMARSFASLDHLMKTQEAEMEELPKLENKPAEPLQFVERVTPERVAPQPAALPLKRVPEKSPEVSAKKRYYDELDENPVFTSSPDSFSQSTGNYSSSKGHRSPFDFSSSDDSDRDSGRSGWGSDSSSDSGGSNDDSN